MISALSPVTVMEGCVKFPLDADSFCEYVAQAKDYAVSHGIVVRTREAPGSADQVTYAPFTLFPSPVPRNCFYHARRVQVDFNILMHRVAHDYEFLRDCLASTVKVDEFTRKMWEIYESVRKEGITQPVCLGMNRSDYMFDQKTGTGQTKYEIKQIEFNTMASSFGGLSSNLTLYHKYIMETAGKHQLAAHLPDNPAVYGLAEGLVTAWQEYGNPNAAVLFLVTDEERNCYDQRHVEYNIKQIEKNIKVIRRSIQYVSSKGMLGTNKQLIIDDLEIAIVYFRSGYAPKDYFTDQDWQGRLLMERSKAICCPNVYYHLAGTKKVQQVLAQPGVLERFISDPVSVSRIRATFAGLHTLDMDADGDRTVEMVMKDASKFVLKPQREGGGNNTFGEDIKNVLGKIKDSEERTAYILMERVLPAQFQNYAIMTGKPVTLQNMVSELGIFGTLVGTKDVIIHNKQHGHILRSKTVGTDEGGVAAGYAALDSPYLTDN